MLQLCWAVLREGAEAATGSMAPRDVLPLSLNVDATPRHFSRSGRVKWQPKLMVRTCDSDPIWPFSHSKLFEAVLWQEVFPEQAWLCRGSDFIYSMRQWTKTCRAGLVFETFSFHNLVHEHAGYLILHSLFLTTYGVGCFWLLLVFATSESWISWTRWIHSVQSWSRKPKPQLVSWACRIVSFPDGWQCHVWQTIRLKIWQKL